MNYQGIKITDEVIIVPRAGQHWEGNVCVDDEYPQGFIVEPGNEKVMATALTWAGKDFKEDPEIKRFKNGTFTLKLYEPAKDSCVSGKLAFWNCLITVETGESYVVGINATLLFDLLSYASFVKGVCQQKVWLGKVAGTRTGAYVEGMPTYEQALKDEAFRQIKPNTDYEVGDIIESKKEKLVYLGKYKTADKQTIHVYADYNSLVKYKIDLSGVDEEAVIKEEFSNWFFARWLIRTESKKLSRIKADHMKLARSALDYVVLFYKLEYLFSETKLEEKKAAGYNSWSINHDEREVQSLKQQYEELLKLKEFN